jgi:2-methylisocitrate lyase-like PEP mutase family enzyme
MTAVDLTPIERSNAHSRRLRELVRAPELLIMPGAWDVMSARFFESIGFAVIQGSSGAISNAMGFADGALSREETVEIYRHMIEAIEIPLNADGEKGYGGPAEVAETVRLMIAAGAAGMNLEDSRPRVPGGRTTLVEIEEARAKVAAVRDTKAAVGSEFFLNARVDAFGAYDNPKEALAEAILRGNAYAELGADCIFYVRAGDAANIRTLVKEVAAPISILASAASPPPRQLEELGVARVSYGTSFFLQSLVNVKLLAETLLAKGDPTELLSKGFPASEVAKIVRTSR